MAARGAMQMTNRSTGQNLHSRHASSEYRRSSAHEINATANMPDQTQFSSDELRLLCDCVATVCVNIAGGRGNERFLPVADAVLAEFGRTAHARSAETGADLAQLVLSEFASSKLRNDVLSRAKLSPDQVGLGRSSYTIAAVTSTALELVDKRCPDQAFPFRAALVLIAMAIEDEMARSDRKAAGKG